MMKTQDQLKQIAKKLAGWATVEEQKKAYEELNKCTPEEKRLLAIIVNKLIKK